MNFKEYLNEAIDMPNVDFHDHRVGTTDLYIFDFEVKGRKFSAIFERDDPLDMSGPQSIWGASYTFQKKPGQSSYAQQNFNDGSALLILSYFMSYLLVFAKEIKPDEIFFTADEGEGARASVYNRIVRRQKGVMNGLGYDFFIRPKKYQTEFVITKQEFMEEEE